MNMHADVQPHVETINGFVAVAPSSMSGWRVVAEPFYADATTARIAAAQNLDAIVLPAKMTKTTEVRRGRVIQRHDVDVDWARCVQRKRETEQWYAIRGTPGMQKMASKLPKPDDETEEQAAEREHRRGESIVERNLRQKGIDVYMPAYWQEVRQHRSRKLVERRYPLLVGYAFIRRDTRLGFYPLRKVEGVSSVVRISEVAGPVTFLEEDSRTIMIEMFKRELRYRYKRLHVIENARYKRTAHLYADLGRALPKGRGRTEGLRDHANRVINTLPDGARSRVLGIFAQLHAMDDDATLDKFRAAL
jgi:Transcription termination factor nusG.